jgi:hypothetical protein
MLNRLYKFFGYEQLTDNSDRYIQTVIPVAVVISNSNSNSNLESIKRIEKIRIKYQDYLKNINTKYDNFILKIFDENEEFNVNSLDINNLNDSIILNLIGLYYHEILQDFEAEKYYLKSIELGNLNTYYNLAHFYYWIEGDANKGIEYSLKSIEFGNDYAMVFMGNHYKNFAGCKNDLELSRDYYAMSAKLNNPIGLRLVA